MSFAKSRFLPGLLTILLVGGLAYLAFLYFKDTTPPAASISPDGPAVGAGTEFTATASDPSGLRGLNVIAEQGGKRVVLAQLGNGGTSPLETTFTLADSGLEDGQVKISLRAVDASLHNFGDGNVAELTRTYNYDTRKPRISLLTGTHNLNRGGSGLALYNLDEKAASGIQVGDRFFPGHQLPSGVHAALFAFPYDMELADFNPLLVARDAAGNMRKRSIPFHANDRSYPHDVINVPDSFLERKMVQYEEEYPDYSPLETYLKVNREMRKRNRAKLVDISRETASRVLWEGRFNRLSNSKTMAGFGDRRTYRYNGEVIDHQTHLGVDLASVRNAQVDAAATGRIVHAGFFGIYGQSVIIDHGIGLMTLYSHLSQIDVEPGQKVDSGDIVGRTGATGLAGGDHLHFGVLVAGLPVNPLEWWDPNWLENNFFGKLRQATATQ